MNHFETAAASRRHNTASTLARTQRQVRGEMEGFLRALSEGQLKDINLTPFQERLRDLVEGTEPRAHAFVDTITQTADNEPAVAAATGQLIGAVVGHAIALESRLAALELALSES